MPVNAGLGSATSFLELRQARIDGTLRHHDAAEPHRGKRDSPSESSLGRAIDRFLRMGMRPLIVAKKITAIPLQMENSDRIGGGGKRSP